RKREITRVARADDGWQTMRAAPRTAQAEPDARLGEARLGRRDTDVTGECELDPATPGGPLEARDDHRIAALDGVRDVLAAAGELVGLLSVEFGARAQIGTRAERRAGTTERDDRCVERLDRGFELVEPGG